MKRLPVVYHVILWALLYAAQIFAFQNRSFTVTRSLTVEFCYLLFIGLDFYLINYLLVPRTLYRKGYILFLSSVTLLFIISAGLRTELALFMNNYIFKPTTRPVFKVVFESSLLNICIWVIVLSSLKWIWDRFQDQQYIRSMEYEKALSELNFLKAQVNPHFLFNSLNSVYGHIDKTNKTARTILLDLSEMLRYQLYECNTEKVSMHKEISYLKHYVSLQRYRQDENLEVEIKTDPALNELMIAPLLLVVFVENAFKYVSRYDEKANKIGMVLERTGGCLHFRVHNSCGPEEEKTRRKETGIGIANVKRRLELLYPSQHQLQISRTEDSYTAELKIDLS